MRIRSYANRLRIGELRRIVNIEKRGVVMNVTNTGKIEVVSQECNSTETEENVLIDNRYRPVKTTEHQDNTKEYLVEDLCNNNHLCHLKTSAPTTFSDEVFLNSKKEFEQLRHLIHPHLIPILDYGYDTVLRRYYFTAEYINGSSFHDHLITHGILSYEYAVNILTDICRTLTFIHSKNMVYGDIQPGTIIISADNELKLMECACSRFSLQEEAWNYAAVYTAPEAFNGNVDWRADIFSLGCTFYQLLTNNVWCGTMDPDTVARLAGDRDAFEEAKTRALEMVDNTSFRCLLDRMITYSAADRFQSCIQIIASVNHSGSCCHPYETVKTAEAYVLSAPYVEHQQEMQQLQHYLHRSDIVDSALVIQGEPGSGKSALFESLQYYCYCQGIPFYSGTCRQEVRLPFQPLLSVISELLFYSEPECISRFGPQLVKLLPGHVCLQHIESSAPQDPLTEYTVLIRTVAEYIIVSTACCARKCVIFLDDLQWSDDASVDVVNLLLKKLRIKKQTAVSPEIQQQHIRLYLGCRNEEIESPLDAIVHDQLEIIQLKQFREQEIGDYVQGIFGTAEVGLKLINGFSLVYNKTHGNPFFLQEVIRWLIINEMITRNEQSWEMNADLEQISIPENLEKLLQSYLQYLNLKPEERKTLEIMALIDRDIDCKELSCIAAVDNGFLLQMQRMGIVKSHRRQQRIVYKIANVVMRTMIIDALSDKEKLHLHIAESMERINNTEGNGNIPVEELAYHYCHAQRTPQVLLYGEKALKNAIAHNQSQAALEYFDKLLPLVSDDDFDKRIEFLFEKAMLLDQVGRSMAAQEIYKQVITLAQKVQNHRYMARAYKYYAQSQRQLADPLEDTLQYLNKALHIWETLDEADGIAELYNEIGLYYFEIANDYDTATSYYLKSMEIGKHSSNVLQKAYCIGNLACIYYVKGDFRQALEYNAQALHLLESPVADDKKSIVKRNIAFGFGQNCLCYIGLKDYKNALYYCEKQIACAQEIESLYEEISGLLKKAEILFFRGRYSEANAVCDTVRLYLCEIDDDVSMFTLDTLTAKICYASGDKTEGIQQLQSLVEKENNPDRVAELIYELWIMTAENAYRDEALRLYQDLVSQISADYIYNKRFNELQNNTPDDIYSEKYHQIHDEDIALPAGSEETLRDELHALIEKEVQTFINEKFTDGASFALNQQDQSSQKQQLIEQLTQNRFFAKLLSIIRDVNSNLAIETLLRKIIDVCIEFLHAERGAILLLNEHDVLEIKTARDCKQQDLLHFPVSSTVTKKMLNERKPIFLPDVIEDAQLSSTQSIIDMDVRSIMCAPLERKSESSPSGNTETSMLGIIYLDNRESTTSDRDGFSESNLELLQALADQASVAIHNALIAEQLQQTAHLLEEEVESRKQAEQDVRALNENLEGLVKKRTAQLEQAQQELLDNAHKAGMADIATAVLHNIGNALNSVVIASDTIQQMLISSRIESLKKASELLKANLADIDTFIKENPKGKKLLEYYLVVSEQLEEENVTLRNQIQRVLEKSKEIEHIVMAQREYALAASHCSSVDLAAIITDALTMHKTLFSDHGIEVSTSFETVPQIMGNKTKLIYVLSSLLKNAQEAMVEIPEDKRQLEVTISQDKPDNFITVHIVDSGCGIPDEIKDKIFNQGFSTKEASGAHFGLSLHTCANFMTEMEGEMSAQSQGPGKGTQFSLKFKAMESSDT